MGSELLSGFRMLDLADEKGALCGKIFADMGADVIKVEPPKGCSTRRIPPFLDDRPHPDRGLYFIAYQAGKRSATLSLDSPDGRALLEDLVRKSDFLLESLPVGYLEPIGLGYERLAELNPRIIHTSVTPFGDTGPGRNYKAADIVSWASGGPMFLMGDEGRPPLEMALPKPTAADKLVIAQWVAAGAPLAPPGVTVDDGCNSGSPSDAGTPDAGDPRDAGDAG